MRSNLDKPGNAYKRNFNKRGTGRFKVKSGRGKASRSKSRR